MSDAIQLEIERLGAIVPWYHRFELPGGVVIPGWEGIYPIWEMIRTVREPIGYAGKRVLDLGSRDGMWAFEAEKRGAATVLATDIGCDGYREHVSFIKALTGSRVGIYYNVPAEEASKRLDCFWQFNPGLFDVVQHLGLLYHLENPIASLRDARKCLVPGGKLLLETAFYRAGDGQPLAAFNHNNFIYEDKTTFWAFNLRTLRAVIELAGFEIDFGTEQAIDQTHTIGRMCLSATAK